jgi:hypothetical protein
MQEVRSHGWRKVESRLEQRSSVTQGAVAETQRKKTLSSFVFCGEQTIFNASVINEKPP